MNTMRARVLALMLAAGLVPAVAFADSSSSKEKAALDASLAQAAFGAIKSAAT